MLTERTIANVGDRHFPALILTTDTETFSLITGGRRIMPSYGYLANNQTVMFARSPDNENPAAVYVAKNIHSIKEALEQSGYDNVGRLNDGATLMRRLGGL